MDADIKTMYYLRAYDTSYRFPIKFLTQAKLNFPLKKDFLQDGKIISLKSEAFP